MKRRRQITPDLEERLELGNEEPSQDSISVSHEHKETCTAVCHRAIITVCPWEILPCPHTACCHRCRVSHTTASCLFLAGLRHNQDGLHHPLAHNPVRVLPLRLFQEESYLQRCIRSSLRSAKHWCTLHRASSLLHRFAVGNKGNLPFQASQHYNIYIVSLTLSCC